jgi:hypothetical protein
MNGRTLRPSKMQGKAHNSMNAQIPIPSFEDIRKLLEFWINQQDKWFYFETETIQTGISGRTQYAPQNIARHTSAWDERNETLQYSQSRIVGKIYEVVSYPPSLLLQDVTVFTVNLLYDRPKFDIVNLEKRKKYGLVFSQITYYEPVEDIETFINIDIRVKQ